MLPIIGWKVYYDDGSTYTSKETTWDALPEHGVQAVCYYHRDGYRTFTNGQDEYRFWGQPESAVKYGRWMTDKAFNSLIRSALDEKERMG